MEYKFLNFNSVERFDLFVFLFYAFQGKRRTL